MLPPSEPIPVGLLGATGMVGQQFIRVLSGHPWFRLTWLAASHRSAGRSYREATRWLGEGGLPAEVADIEVVAARPDAACPSLVFSAMDARVAGDIERAFAGAGHMVVSNSRNHRMEPDVPLVVPEINAEHLGLIPTQRRRRGWPGAIVTNPNCSTIGLVLALGAMRPFGIKSCVVTTLQALSGAGHPGVSALDILGNVVPYIGDEEIKIANETVKILGTLGAAGRVEPLATEVSAHCNRVPVIDGHLICVSVALDDEPTAEVVGAAMASFKGPPQELALPSAPARPLRMATAVDRPQPSLDVAAAGGMAVTVGRVRRCPVMGLKFVALVHNTIRGAAGASVLNAELMRVQGWLDE